MQRSALFAFLALAVVASAVAKGPPSVGEIAPDFTLSDQDGNPVTLSKQRDSIVVLLFYRGHW